MSDDWFAPKRFGYGAGLPISWQGWTVLIGYVVTVTAAGLLLPRLWPVWLTIMICATWLLIVVARRHTRGGWKWRSGERD